MNNFDTTDCQIPRTITPRRWLVGTVPPASDCTPEQLLDLAAAAAQDRDTLWSLLGSSEHVAAICELLSARVEPALRVADRECEELQIKHAHAIRALEQQRAASRTAHETERAALVQEICDARDAHQVTALRLEYVADRLLEEQREAQRLRDLGIALSADAARARHLTEATLLVANLTYLDVQARIDAADRLAEGSDVHEVPL